MRKSKKTIVMVRAVDLEWEVVTEKTKAELLVPADTVFAPNVEQKFRINRVLNVLHLNVLIADIV